MGNFQFLESPLDRVGREEERQSVCPLSFFCYLFPSLFHCFNVGVFMQLSKNSGILSCGISPNEIEDKALRGD